MHMNTERKGPEREDSTKKWKRETLFTYIYNEVPRFLG